MAQYMRRGRKTYAYNWWGRCLLVPRSDGRLDTTPYYSGYKNTDDVDEAVKILMGGAEAVSVPNSKEFCTEVRRCWREYLNGKAMYAAGVARTACDGYWTEVGWDKAFDDDPQPELFAGQPEMAAEVQK